MNVSQCDNCRRLDPALPPPHWLILLGGEPASSPLSALFGEGPEIKGMFCGWRCVAEYTTVKALADSVGETGAEGNAGGAA